MAEGARRTEAGQGSGFRLGEQAVELRELGAVVIASGYTGAATPTVEGSLAGVPTARGSQAVTIPAMGSVAVEVKLDQPGPPGGSAGQEAPGGWGRVRSIRALGRFQWA